MARIDLTNERILRKVAEIAAKCAEKEGDYTKAKALFFKECRGMIEKEDIKDMERIFHQASKAVKQGKLD